MDAEQALGFDEIRHEVGTLALTERGCRLVLNQQPHTTVEELERALSFVTPLHALLSEGIASPAGDVPALDVVWQRLAIEGSVLEVEELAAVRALCACFLEFRRFLTHERAVPQLHEAAAQMEFPEKVRRELMRYLLPTGEVNEIAIPEIGRLRGQIGRLHQEVLKSAQGIIRSNREMFRAEEPTIRDGRTVVALAANFRGRVQGIMHESSASGNTLFVEPTELVELNNRFIILNNRIHQEIQRVLRELSTLVREHRIALQNLDLQLAELDAHLARALYSYRTRGVRIQTGSRVALRRARHPALGRACVPIDVTFDPGVRVLIVSGPNTGGKTVALKTLGLLALMHQFGLLLPCGEESELPVFDFVGVDIGDEQSISASLSTFSAHLRSLAALCREAGPRSLILIDELGTGTDPEEGAALSLAIIDHLIARGSVTLCTTHQTVLKHYGYTHSGARNAAMEFDTDQHRPTYRVLAGIPGASHALEAATASGLAADIVQRARDYLDSGRSDIAAILSRLVQQEQAVQARAAALDQELISIEERSRALQAREGEIQQREIALKRQGLAELREVIHSSRSAIERAVRELREQNGSTAAPEAEREARVTVAAAVQTVQELEAEIESATQPLTIDHSLPLAVGTFVQHERSGQTGTILSIKGERAEVQFGGVRMRIASRELLPVRQSHRKPEVSAQYEGAAAGRIVLELDLRGQRVHEALAELERHIDRAILAGVSSFAIVHGTGTGALQKAVHDALRLEPRVTGFGFSRPEDGGFGRTTVQLG